MTSSINRPTDSNKLKFIQLIIPILLALMVFLLGLIAFVAKLSYTEFRDDRKIQQEINNQVLEKLSDIKFYSTENRTDVLDLKKNDRLQDLLLQQHETTLNLLKK